MALRTLAHLHGRYAFVGQPQEMEEEPEIPKQMTYNLKQVRRGLCTVGNEKARDRQILKLRLVPSRLDSDPTTAAPENIMSYRVFLRPCCSESDEIVKLYEIV